MENRPKCNLIGTDGNVFALIGTVARTLKAAKKPEAAKEMTERVFKSKSYGEALNIMGEYVEIY